MENESKQNKPALKYLKFFGRIILILFIGLSLYLFVSSIMMAVLTKSAKDVKVADVTGQQFADVYNSLVRKGLKPELIFHDTFDVESGVVIKQHPEAGTIVPEGDPIKLTVSRSGYFIEVPNLVGKSLPVAKNSLSNLHYHGRTFAVGTGAVSFVPSDKTAENIVIAQSPKAGEKITPEQIVCLLVSAGQAADTRLMPNVKDQTIDLAFDLLSAKKLNVIQETADTWDKTKSGVIIEQTPAAGAAVAVGAVVRLKVALYPLHGHPYYAYEKFNYTIPANQSEGLYEAQVEDETSKRICFAATMGGGGQINFVYHRTGKAKISILKDKTVLSVIGVNVENF